jgi:hypothetical protein
MNSNDQQVPVARSAKDAAFRKARRRLAMAILRQCLVCGIVVFFVTLVLSSAPFPFGPDYLFAALVGSAAAVTTGIVLAALVYLEIQRFLAQRAGSSLSYRLGRWLHKSLTSAVRR